MRITKRQLRRIIKETLLCEDADFDRVVSSWNSGVDRHGNQNWKKSHKNRSAHITSDQAVSKWQWVVFEFKPTPAGGMGDGIEDDIGQGTEISLRAAILAADKVLKTGIWEY